MSANTHRGGTERGASTTREEWMTPKEFANEYHVSRSSAYEAFGRLHTVRIGGSVRARRSEIERLIAERGRI